MLKVGLLCGVIAAMSATGLKADLQKKFESKPCDARFIIELEDDIENISADEAIKKQDAIVKKIQNSVNKNATKDRNFSLLTNAVVINASKEDVEAIREIPGVKYVTENGTHVVKMSRGSNGMSIDLTSYKAGASEIDLTQNASAITMHKPDNTNDGEGTLIAVLDNEFYLRGKYKDASGTTQPAYNHVTFTALPSGTKQRLTFNKVKDLAVDLGIKQTSKTPGEEGSLYFNTKVPYYYDYAGDSYTGNDYGAVSDFNVESTVDLHGSHVSSIAAGNDPDYKGIAPKAQLALMKVFTDVHASPASDAANLGSYGSFNEVGFIQALEDCIKIGVDAINVSIGSDLADFEQGSISQRTLQKISDHGILAAISAGNGGKGSYAFTGGYGYWTRDVVETGIMGSFANNASTMSIAAGQPEWTFYENSLRIGDSDEVVPFDDQIVNRDGSTSYDEEHKLHELIQDVPDVDVDPTEAEQARNVDYVYVKGFGQEKDYKNLTDEKDPAGKIVIVNRGKINFSEKLSTAINHNAAGLIIINNDPTDTSFNFRCDFGTTSVDIPVAVVLFRDKPLFDANPYGTFKIKKNTPSINKLAYTVSDFSTDGPTYDLDLKPEITTPGSNIKGAVWPQNKKERINSKYSSYEYFDGTSMAAPNYEGAIAVLLSKVTAGTASDSEIAEFKKSIDMKFMSTANPMTDVEPNGENQVKTLISPRMQGAGMVDLEKAYATDVYLAGKDCNGNELNRSKILLRNNEDIANGKVKLGFTAYNDGDVARSYDVKFNVMRPASAECNKVLTSDYHDPVEYDDVRNIPGFKFYSPEEEKVIYAEGNASYKDVIKISKAIEYFETAEQYEKYDRGEPVELPKLEEGMYYCADENPDWKKGIRWEVVPASLYQSTKDIQLAEVDCGTITVEPGKNEFSLKEYKLTDKQKEDIASLYKTGTYIEGFVTLTSKSEATYPSLSMPYLGFYSLTDLNPGSSYSTPAVVEPFDFEKDSQTIYGSDLVNDVTKQLLGKDNVDFGSMMLAGYAQNPENINTDKILTNDLSFKNLMGFQPVGTKPNTTTLGYEDNPSHDIYIGNPRKTNTLIIQQFVMRSCSDNKFSIVSKDSSHEVIYKSALEDMLFGATFGKNTLYKSHVSANYLGGGYVAHRAYSIVPLYDLKTKEPFPSGDYELKFEYQLAATGEWITKSYDLHIDSDTPLVSSIRDYKDGSTDMVRITYKDTRVAYAKVGPNQVEVKYDETEGVYYSEVTKELIDSVIASSKPTSFSDKRLFLTVVDYARGETTAIVHFNGNDYSHFTIAQGQEFTINSDFALVGGKLVCIEVQKDGTEVEFKPVYKVILVDGVPGGISGNKGLVIGLSVGGGVLVLGGVGVLLYFLVFKKKKLL